jgi:hypothetical protein
MPAPNYYYSTPIGQNISTLANAVQSIPAHRAQLGLYEARQRLMDQQMLTEEQQAANYGAMARMHGAQADIHELTHRGRQMGGQEYLDWADKFGSSGAQGGAAQEVASAGPPAGVAQAVVGPTARAVAVAPPGARSPGLAGAIGLTPQMVARQAAYGLWAGGKPEDMMRMHGAGQLSAVEKDPEAALAFLETGAGSPFQQTRTGVRRALEQAEEAAKLKARTDVDIANIQARAHVAAAGARAAGRGAGGKDKSPLTIPQQQKLHKNVMDEAENEGLTLKPAEANLVVKKIMERMKEGEDYLQVLDEELTNMVQEVPEEKVSFGTRGNFLGRDKPAHKAFKSPYAESADDAVATSAGQPTGESGAKAPVGHAPWAAKEVYGAIPAALPITSLAGALLGDKAGLGPKVASLVQSMTASGPEYAKGEAAPLPAAAEGAAFAPEPTSAPIKAPPPVAPASVAQKASKKKGSAKPLDTLPAGAKYVGTSGGKPVFELPDGTRRVKE